MKVLLINNDGGGFADYIEVDEGTSVAALVAEKMPGRKPGDFLIRVNRLPVTGDQILQPNDRISITPVKIEGARAV
jgi:sulfur carrier protein ThiS